LPNTSNSRNSFAVQHKAFSYPLGYVSPKDFEKQQSINMKKAA